MKWINYQIRSVWEKNDEIIWDNLLRPFRLFPLIFLYPFFYIIGGEKELGDNGK